MLRPTMTLLDSSVERSGKTSLGNIGIKKEGRLKPRY